MRAENQLTRAEAVEELERFGISGAEVYLIDFIPLIEMMWADERIQMNERAQIIEYAGHHLEHINRLFGYEALTMADVRSFLTRFLDERPDPELLKRLRSLLPTLRLSVADPEANRALKESLLGACIDIAGSASTSGGSLDTIHPGERRCFFEILDTLE